MVFTHGMPISASASSKASMSCAWPMRTHCSTKRSFSMLASRNVMAVRAMVGQPPTRDEMAPRSTIGPKWLV
jgi:hypothetical protein